MGTSGSKTKEENTQVDMRLDHQVAQAGAQMTGTISIKIGKSDQKMLEQFTAGAIVEVIFNGEERVFWAPGYSHDPERRTQKQLTHGDKRRESYRVIF